MMKDKKSGNKTKFTQDKDGLHVASLGPKRQHHEVVMCNNVNETVKKTTDPRRSNGESGDFRRATRLSAPCRTSFPIKCKCFVRMVGPPNSDNIAVEQYVDSSEDEISQKEMGRGSIDSRSGP
jgi:hypothetical protein